MSEHAATNESEASTRSEFGKFTRRTFLSRLGIAGYLPRPETCLPKNLLLPRPKPRRQHPTARFQ